VIAKIFPIGSEKGESFDSPFFVQGDQAIVLNRNEIFVMVDLLDRVFEQSNIDS